MLVTRTIIHTNIMLSIRGGGRFRRWLLLFAVVLAALYVSSSVDAQVGATNLVPNSSLERVSSTNPALPASWTTGRWGNLDARFTYRTTGRTGGRSVQLDITRYVNGDAKWY